MYRIDNHNIGKHLAELIKESTFKSDRQFAIAYLEKRDGADYDQDDIQKMQNRICQIKKGNKGIQIEDLPIISELLEVSIDDILSAGETLVPVNNRITNYSIAYSKDPEEWKAYVNREDKLILNPDEYNKTVIDYALEAGNYPFLKFLMDNGYIWFVGDDKMEYHDDFGEHFKAGFGAGTSIKRRDVGYIDTLSAWFAEKDDLRFKMITLAIKNKDYDMLEQLHAREIPMLYSLNNYLNANPRSDRLPQSNNVDTMIRNIATCKDKRTLAYFFGSFEVESQFLNAKNTFIFPYAGVLLDTMIKCRSKHVTYFIQQMSRYNASVLATLHQAVEDAINSLKDYHKNMKYDFYKDDFYNKQGWREYYFYPKTGFVAYTSPWIYKEIPDRGFITNVVKITAKSSDPEIQSLIDELNESYDAFIQLYKEKEKRR